MKMARAPGSPLLLRLILLVLLTASLAAAADLLHERSDLAARVNAAQSDWTASLASWTAVLPRADARRLLGLRAGPNGLRSRLALKSFDEAQVAAAPEAFDSRTQWSQCTTIQEIRDQSICGSCWAFGAVEAMSDRECIRNGKVVRLSAEDMNSCSGCGGCDGGYPDCAWSYWATTGVVSEECFPYSIPGCDHHVENSSNPCPDKDVPTPRCTKRCVAGSGLSWGADKHVASRAYQVSGEGGLMAEVSQNGPCEVSLSVYEDFLLYKSGVYHHVSGSYEGGHAVKLVGWGAEKGVKYWIIANSWNTHWGEGGFFRIRRGNNECGIERSASCGLPK